MYEPSAANRKIEWNIPVLAGCIGISYGLLLRTVIFKSAPAVTKILDAALLEHGMPK